MADRKRIGLHEIRAMLPNSEIWDSAVIGFGARRQKSEAIAYLVLYRTAEGRSRRFTIGRHGAPWTPDEARKEAKRILGAVANGEDPATAKKARRNAITINELCDTYYDDAKAGRILTRRRIPKTLATLATDKSRIDAHIKPLLGNLTVATVTSRDVEALMHAIQEGKTAKRAVTNKKRGLSNIRGGKGAASRTIGLLGGIFTYAVKHGIRADNPVHGVVRPADGKRERRLRDEDYLALGEGLRKAEAAKIWPAAIEGARFLALTGWRKSEMLKLRWDDFNLQKRTAWLDDTKTGQSKRPLSQTACGLLGRLDRLDELVFPSTRGEGIMSGFYSIFRRIAELGGLQRAVTLHTLRHSLASLASDIGYSEGTIAELIGHERRGVTAGYIHPADKVVLAAADAVAKQTAKLMGEDQKSQLPSSNGSTPKG